MPASMDRAEIRLSAAFAVARLRTDLWIRMSELADEIVLRDKHGKDTEHRREALATLINDFHVYEKYWAFPGPARIAEILEVHERGDYEQLAILLQGYAKRIGEFGDLSVPDPDAPSKGRATHEFTVILVDDSDEEIIDSVVGGIRSAGLQDADFRYELLHLDNVIDGLAAVLLNRDVQACIIRSDAQPRGPEPGPFEAFIDDDLLEELTNSHERGLLFGRMVRDIRPELDLYLLTTESAMVEKTEDHEVFDRVFYSLDDPIEMHLTVIEGVRNRYETPFFDALVRYSQKPVGNFHALPIARGHSIFNGRWIRDMGQFYGRNIFLAETSSTSGGLDSLLAPHGPIAEAQAKAAKAFGSFKTFFSTNGTSTSNKVVVQALTGPGDIVLIDRNCHISHHYGLVLGGASPLYLDAYPLPDFTIFGAVPLRTIKEQLLKLKAEGRLDQAKMLLLTNCTFDGVVYDPFRVMSEVLAIKPDMIFLWDEAWFAFATFSPLMRPRTAMASARRLKQRFKSAEYREQYEQWRSELADLDWDDDQTWLDNSLLPDPDLAKVRIYSTHSTHKSLSALRQGSMMHVEDEEFERTVIEDFTEALQTHTSTSPNYQVVASLDLARRQAQLEGYGMVSDTYQMAMTLRQRVAGDPLLSKFFRVLGPKDLIPEEFRPSGVESYVKDYTPGTGTGLVNAIAQDEFVLNPTRNTLYLGLTGVKGDDFKVGVLMNRFGIQVNKTSINSVLMIMSIGVTWSSMAYVLDALTKIAQEFEAAVTHESQVAGAARRGRVKATPRIFPRCRPSVPSTLHFNRWPDPATATCDRRFTSPASPGRCVSCRWRRRLRPPTQERNSSRPSWSFPTRQVSRSWSRARLSARRSWTSWTNSMSRRSTVTTPRPDCRCSHQRCSRSIRRRRADSRGRDCPNECRRCIR